MRTHRALVVAAATFLAFYSLSCASYSQPAGAAIGLDVTAAMRTAHFAEPLIATSSTTPGEDRALMQALAQYDRRVQPDDVSALTQFLSQYPASGWSPALLTNLGLIYVHYGYFSQAIEAWEAAWRVGRNAGELRWSRLSEQIFRVDKWSLCRG